MRRSSTRASGSATRRSRRAQSRTASARVAAALLDAVDDLVDDQALPRGEHLLEQGVAVGEVPERLDADHAGTAGGESPQASSIQAVRGVRVKGHRAGPR